jgi:phosphoglycerate kinase
MALRTLDSLGSLAGKRVIVRADLNVPLKDQVITDDGRVRATLPTLNTLINQGARLIICSHLGRPDGEPNPAYSLAPVAQRLSELLAKPVAFARDTVGESAHEAVAALQDGDVAVIENLRFNPGETSKNTDERRAFAEQLAELGDVLVSDGFGVVHRKQASVYELAEILPSAAGSLIATELDVLDRLTEKPERPYAVVLGGSKVSDKLGVIAHLLPRVDTILVGGGMLFTFLAAKGYKVGASLLEQDQLDTVSGYIREAEERGVDIVLPVDAVMAASFSADADHVVADAETLEDTPFGASGMGLDIGPRTAEIFADVIRRSKTVFWNGPMGVFEMPAFAAGTKTVAQALTEVDGLSVVGGGDSAAAVRQLGFRDDQFGHISTGGGASLEFLEGKKLPGLEVLGWSQ